MVYKDEVCMWFKDNESHRRLELLCGLFNMCLPFELRFIRTCVEDLGKRDDLLRDFDSKANNSAEINQLGKVLDERTRSKFVVYVALLEANNQTCSKILFDILSNSQQISNSALLSNINDNINYIKEMLLIYTMVLHHPAFTFEEKRIIGERLQSLQIIEDQINSSKKSWNKNTYETENDISIDSCHPISSPQLLEACDSGLSIGTEPEVEVLSEHVCVHSGIQPLHVSGTPTSDNKFSEIIASKDLKPADRPVINPSIGIKSSEKVTSDFDRSTTSSVTSISPSTDEKKSSSGNRDASSSGSGESLDLYGENLSVPTTYIYNSNIYEQQNLTEVPALALSNNMINFTPGYMYQHNGRCHFYHYPSIVGSVVPSIPLPRKPSPPGLSSGTSSSEEGSTQLVTKQLREGLSPLSSSHSSPYASPPQSLTPSRASSPKEAATMVTSSHISHGLVTCTTTTIVISRSNQRPAIRHSSSTGSSNNSQPSSPALTSNSISRNTNSNNNKIPLLAKCRKYSNDRLCNLNSESCPVEGPLWNNGSSNVGLRKDSSTESYSYNSKSKVSSSNTPCVDNDIKYCEKCKDSTSTTLHKSIPTSVVVCHHTDKDLLGVNVNAVLPNISPTALTSSGSIKSSITTSLNATQGSSFTTQKGTSNCLHQSPIKASIKNQKEKQNKENLMRDSSVDTEKSSSKETLSKEFFNSLPNGFNEHLLVSSAHLVPLKHSNVSTSPIPSCSCSHISVSPVLLQSDPGRTISSNNGKQKMSSPVSQGTENSLHSSIKLSQGHQLVASETLSLPNNCQVIQSHLSITTATTTTTTTLATTPEISAGLHENTSQMQQNILIPKGDVPDCSSIVGSSVLEKNGSMIPKTSPQNSSTLINAAIVNTSSLPVSVKASPTDKYIMHTGGPLNVNASHCVNKPYHGENGPLLQTLPLSTAQMGSCTKPPLIGTVSSTTMTSTSPSVVSLVPSPATYPPYISIPILPGGPPSFLSQGAYPSQGYGHPRNPSHGFYLASSTGMIHGNSNHLIKNHPHIPPSGSNIHNNNNNKSRGSSGRSGSSSSSSSSGLSRKKGFIRGNQYQNKSRSSDSSPSSSQYSSPPQTPSPDHIKDVRSKPGGPKNGKTGDGYSVDEIWERSEINGHCQPNPGSREEETPPPNPVGTHIMIPSNPVRQRYIPYHSPLGFIGYPHPHSHHGMYRYSLASPSVVMGPRPPTPLSSEKSSRETTPPNHARTALGPDTSQKIMEYPSAVSSSASASPSSFNMCSVVSTPSIGHSSTSPPIPGPITESSSITLVPPPPSQTGHSVPANGGMNSSIPNYNSPNYPMFAMGANPFMHLSGFMQSSSGLPNGYVPSHNLPPNYPVPSLPSGMNSGELLYPNPYPIMAQSTLATSSCGGHPVLHQSSGTHAPIITPSPGLPPFTPYQIAPPPHPPNPVPPPIKKALTCYNCGKVGHRGSECKEASIEEMTKRTKVL